jgi:benzoyl-CoA reductase/2-hydroxyglutaryl-CoA dehydratase subunit BcrC/BadD/HgdB
MEFNEDFDLLKYLSDYTDAGHAHCMAKYPEREWMFNIQKAAWNGIYQAKDQGKKLIMCGAAVPPELIWAFDGVPLLLDAVATRIASDPEVINRYLDISAQHIPTTVCGIETSALGIILSGDLKVKPDAYIYGTIPCDSSRVVYPKVAEMLEAQGVPTFAVDTPYRTDEYGYKYIADQLWDLTVFLEGVLETKLDWKKMAATIMRANEATELLQKNGNLRKLKPCPGMSRLLVLNELYQSMVGSQAMVDFLRAEFDFVLSNVEHGRTAVKEEKHRYTWLQDMVWSNVGLLDWLEREYGAVLVMDVLGYESSVIIDDPWDKEQVYMGMAERQLATPMLHASSGPATPYIDVAERIINEYGIDMTMFVGHVGCKHTWACAKMVKDGIESRFGIPSLTLDLDALDGRYKTTEEIKVTISEYIESADK